MHATVAVTGAGKENQEAQRRWPDAFAAKVLSLFAICRCYERDCPEGTRRAGTEARGSGCLRAKSLLESNVECRWLNDQPEQAELTNFDSNRGVSEVLRKDEADASDQKFLHGELVLLISGPFDFPV